MYKLDPQLVDYDHSSLAIVCFKWLC